MKQTLHIFFKDVRQFWPEIALSLLVTAVFTRIYPHAWKTAAFPALGADWLPGLFIGLLPVTWWLLTTRVIHAESLVGEQQFWITRPYRWGSLLAAKVLFILAFACLPFLIGQCVLLKEAGFHPFAYLPGLFFNLAIAIGIIALPAAALATVTNGIAKAALALIFVAIYIGGIAYASTLLPSESAPDFYGSRILFGILVSTLVMVVALQYAARSTALSRWLLVALALSLGVFAFKSPDDLPTRLAYPPHTGFQQPAVLLALKPVDSKKQTRTFSDADDKREVELALPLAITGIMPGTAVKADYLRIEITGPHGEHWQSQWQGAYKTWSPGTIGDTVEVKINRAFAERVKTLPVTIDLSFAVTELQTGRKERVILPKGTFSIPGGSICELAVEDNTGLRCFSPLRQPPLMFVLATLASAPCSGPSPAEGEEQRYEWLGNLDTDPAEFALTSVFNTPINLQRFSGEQSSYTYALCPGSAVSFMRYSISDRTQEHIRIPSAHLLDFVRNVTMY
jgi:hypothetical protein